MAKKIGHFLGTAVVFAAYASGSAALLDYARDTYGLAAGYLAMGLQFAGGKVMWDRRR